jgi:hypothetical protein
MKRKQGALLVAHEIIKKKMGNEENHGDNRSDEKRKWYDPQKRNRLLERRAPVVEFFILQTILLQIERKLDQMIDIDTNSKSICENELSAVQAESLRPDGSQQNVSKDRHRSMSRKVK